MDLGQFLQLWQMAALGGTILGGTGIGIYNKWKDRRLDQKRHSFEYDQEETEQIELLLNDALYSSEADRISMFEFHNGVRYLSNRAGIRMTCTHEHLREGIEPHADRYINLPIQPQMSFLKSVKDNGGVVFADTDDMPMSITKALTRKANICSFATVPLIDQDKQMIGFISASYIHSRTPEQLYEARSLLQETAGQVCHVYIR